MTMTALPITRCKYEFGDMNIVVLIDEKSAVVYLEADSNLMYVFSVEQSDFAQIDIKALHDNGYFDDFIWHTLRFS